MRPFSFYGFAPLIPESGWSFPSGHMLWFFALSMTVWYTNRRWGTVFFILSALMGIARIYAGVHWPLDVLGGAVIGVLCSMAIHVLLSKPRAEIG
jgi:undecaprenyl-diphosphatase